MYYNQELGLCIEFGPVRVDSVRRGGGAPPGSNPPCAGSRRRGLLPGLLVIACYLSFTPLLSQVRYYKGFRSDSGGHADLKRPVWPLQFCDLMKLESGQVTFPIRSIMDHR